jgi:hypothetical protein
VREREVRRSRTADIPTERGRGEYPVRERERERERESEGERGGYPSLGERERERERESPHVVPGCAPWEPAPCSNVLDAAENEPAGSTGRDENHLQQQHVLLHETETEGHERNGERKGRAYRG